MCGKILTPKPKQSIVRTSSVAIGHSIQRQKITNSNRTPLKIYRIVGFTDYPILLRVRPPKPRLPPHHPPGQGQVPQDPLRCRPGKPRTPRQPHREERRARPRRLPQGRRGARGPLTEGGEPPHALLPGIPQPPRPKRRHSRLQEGKKLVHHEERPGEIPENHGSQETQKPMKAQSNPSDQITNTEAQHTIPGIECRPADADPYPHPPDRNTTIEGGGWGSRN